MNIVRQHRWLAVKAPLAPILPPTLLDDLKTEHMTGLLSATSLITDIDKYSAPLLSTEKTHAVVRRNIVGSRFTIKKEFAVEIKAGLRVTLKYEKRRCLRRAIMTLNR